MRNRRLIVLLLSILAGCAVNRVEEVNTKDDAESLYKVPVVYGIGVKEDSLPLSGSTVGFAEYDPETKKGTATCLGSDDMFWLNIGTRGHPLKPDDRQLHYHVLMVPPGYYGLMDGDGLLYEAKPSLYIKVEKGVPLYLGDFWFAIHEADPEHHYYMSKIPSPVEYHPESAVKALDDFDIPSKGMKQADLIPTDGVTRFLLCTP